MQNTVLLTSWKVQDIRGTQGYSWTNLQLEYCRTDGFSGICRTNAGNIRVTSVSYPSQLAQPILGPTPPSRSASDMVSRPKSRSSSLEPRGSLVLAVPFFLGPVWMSIGVWISPRVPELLCSNHQTCNDWSILSSETMQGPGLVSNAVLSSPGTGIASNSSKESLAPGSQAQLSSRSRPHA